MGSSRKLYSPHRITDAPRKRSQLKKVDHDSTRHDRALPVTHYNAIVSHYNAMVTTAIGVVTRNNAIVTPNNLIVTSDNLIVSQHIGIVTPDNSIVSDRIGIAERCISTTIFP